jgi:recombination protein RecT
MTIDSTYQPVAQPKSLTTHQLLTRLTPEIQRALPKGMDADRIARLVMTEIRKNPKLAECTQESFAGALLTASALGLEPGVQGESYLVPYKDSRRRVTECQLIVGYQGIVKLFWQHPRAARVDSQCVYANDDFGYTKGLRPELFHRAAQGDRGDPVAYYAIVGIQGADPMWDVFTPEQIAKLRRGKVGPKGDIPDPERWMERKTALKQVLKMAPKSTRLDLAIRSDEQGGSDLYKSQAMDSLPLQLDSGGALDGEVDRSDEVAEMASDNA